MQQLETNAKEFDTINEQLGFVEINVKNEYELFQTNLNQKRRIQTEALASDALKYAKTMEQAREDAENAAKSSATSQKITDGKKFVDTIIEKITPTTLTIIKPTESTISFKKTSTENKAITNALGEILPGALEEFNSFLNDSMDPLKKTDIKYTQTFDDDDKEKIKHNPMVSYVRDLLSSDEDNDNNKRNYISSISDKENTVKLINSSNNTVIFNLNDKSNPSDVSFFSYLFLFIITCSNLFFIFN
jgi:hypothetical protein